MKFSKTARGAIAQVSMDACSLHKSIVLKVQFECCSTIKAGQTRIHDRKVWAGCIVKLNTYELRNERCVFVQTSDSARYCYHVMKFSKTAREAIAQVSMDACSLHKSIMFKVQFECCNTIKAGQTRILNRKVWAGCKVHQYVQAERRKMGERADDRYRNVLLSCDEVQQDSTRSDRTSKHGCMQPSQSIMFKVQFECCNIIKAGQTRIHERKVWAGCIVKLNTYELRDERWANARTTDTATYCYHVMKFSKTAREAIAQVSMDACSLHKSIMFKVQFECCNTIKAGQTRIHHRKVSAGSTKSIRTSWETPDVRTRRRPIQPNVRGVWSSSARQHAKR